MNNFIPSSTLLLKQIFKTIDEFKAYEGVEDMINSLNTEIVTDGGADLFRILYRHYKNYEVAFDTPDSFVDAFSEIFEAVAPNYYTQKKWYNKVLSLNEKELLEISSSIENAVDNTNEHYDNPFEAPLKNITSQNSSKEYGEVASRLRAQVSRAQTNVIRGTIYEFKKLFIRIGLVTNYYDKPC